MNKDGTLEILMPKIKQNVEVLYKFLVVLDGRWFLKEVFHFPSFRHHLPSFLHPLQPQPET